MAGFRGITRRRGKTDIKQAVEGGGLAGAVELAGHLKLPTLHDGPFRDT